MFVTESRNQERIKLSARTKRQVSVGCHRYATLGSETKTSRSWLSEINACRCKKKNVKLGIVFLEMVVHLSWDY